MDKSPQTRKDPPEFLPRRKRKRAPKMPITRSIVGAFAITLILGGIVYASSLNQDTPTQPTASKINYKPISKTNTVPKHFIRKPTQQDQQTNEMATTIPLKQKNSHHQDDFTYQETATSQYQSKNIKPSVTSKPDKQPSQKHSSIKPEKKQASKQTTSSKTNHKERPTQQNQRKDKGQNHVGVNPGNNIDPNKDKSKEPSKDQNNTPSPAPKEKPTKKGILSPILKTLKLEKTLSKIIPIKEKKQQ